MGNHLEHHLAGQQAQPHGLGLAEQPVQGGRERLAGVRRRPVVQGDTAALVLGENAGMTSREGLQPLTDGNGEARCRLMAQRLVGVCSPMGAMTTTGRQPQRCEDPIEVIHRAAADQRERATQP
ncbi:hypothetical protein D3C78_1287850 [compost metagenome]